MARRMGGVRSGSQKPARGGIENAEAEKENAAFPEDGSGMRVAGWLSDENAVPADTAFGALTGRKSADDARTLPQRRAEALVQSADAKLDEGSLGKGVRSRRHCSVRTRDARRECLNDGLDCARRSLELGFLLGSGVGNCPSHDD